MARRTCGVHLLRILGSVSACLFLIGADPYELPTQIVVAEISADLPLPPQDAPN